MNWLNRLVCRWRGHEWSTYETPSITGCICTRCGRVIATMVMPPELARRLAELRRRTERATAAPTPTTPLVAAIFEKEEEA